MSDIPHYWNPLPTVRTFTANSANATADLNGRWAERNWKNVPGPFYGADTDSCWTGRTHAPENVLYDEKGQEFVYRQPRDTVEVKLVLDAAWDDPMTGYAVDGDQHWTVGSVREWWADRGRIRAWIDGLVPIWDESPKPEVNEAAAGLRAYREFLDSGLETYLRGYLFWLAENREPGPGDTLPAL